MSKNGYDFYLKKCLLPIAPEKLQVKINNANDTLTLINEGEINILKTPELTDIEFECRIPQVKYPFATYKSGFKGASYFLDYFESLKADKKPFQFIVSRTLPNGKVLFSTNMKVSMEDYKITEQAKDGFDLTVKIKLKQYRDYGTKTVNIKIAASKPKAKVEPQRPTDPPAQKSYKVGDIVQLIKRRPIFPNDEKHFYSGAFSTMDTMSRKYPYSVNDNANIWRNGMPAFSGSVKFDNGINYTYFTIRDDKYVYSIEVAYKANTVKTSYHEIRNMVEMAKLINHPHKQEFPAVKYIWEADVFKLP